MKIVVAGTRGIPNIQGGVETHCHELYPRLAKKGLDIILVRRSCYVSPDNNISEFEGVKIKDIYAPRKKSIEAIVHTFLSVIYAKKQKADILHIHAIGPALLTPFARLLGLKVVVTHHGADYDRQKWGRMAKLILKSGEKFAAKYANDLIVISKVIQSSLKDLYQRDTNIHLIPNGVNIPTISNTTEYINSIGLDKNKYIIALGRFVEEKGFHNLINAYFNSDYYGSYKLVIAGDADHETDYSQKLKQLAKSKNIILTGFIKGEPLNELFSHARLFVLSSFHEGLPIALLEAMSYNLDIIVSDIPANRQVDIPNEDYYDPYNVNELTSKINQKLNVPKAHQIYDLNKYNWDYIAEQTLMIYKKST